MAQSLSHSANNKQNNSTKSTTADLTDKSREHDMIILMRHSRRADQHPKMLAKNGLIWPERDQFLRPYDPPICDYDLPIQLIQEVVSLIPDIRITKIVVSPCMSVCT